MGMYSDNPWLEQKIQKQLAFQQSMQGGSGIQGSLDDLKSVVNGDQFFYSRLPGIVNDLRNGDMSYFNQEFGTSGNRDQVMEMAQRYSYLLDNGYTNADIMGNLYGTDGSSWASWDEDGPKTNMSGHPVGGSNGNQSNQPDPQDRTLLSWNNSDIGKAGSAWGSRNQNQNRLFSPENEAMRKAIGDNLEKKLFG
jgi:hypothetical protein